MSDKFQCHYNLKFNWVDEKGNPQQEIVTDPVSIQFNITKTTQNDNSTRIIVYNLDSSVREAIYQDRLLLKRDDNVKWVTLEAGYGEKLTLVSLGYIQECSSVRSGVDFITTIDVIDPDILTEYTGVTFEAGTTFDVAYKYLISHLPSLQLGETGGLSGAFKMPTTFDGNAFLLVNKLTGGHTFVDNGVIHTLNDNETRSDYGCYYISADTGLLETPKRYGAILEVQMLFEPTIKIGQMVDIKSDTWGTNLKDSAKSFCGQYKVQGLTHSCLISNAECGTRTTTLQLQYLKYLTDSNVNLTDNPQGAPASVVKNNKIEPISTRIDSDVESIYQQILRFNGSVPKGLPITHSISWHEMIYCGNNQPQDVRNSITRQYLAACKVIATKLTEFLDKSSLKGKPIILTSGYRTPQNNASNEASSNNSNHKYGRAIDFYVKGVSIVTLRNLFINGGWPYGLGIYLKNNFIHVSTNPNERFTVKKKV